MLTTKETRIRVKDNEAGSAAIDRYMERRGYKKEVWQKANAVREYYTKGDECLRVWGQYIDGKYVVAEIGNV